MFIYNKYKQCLCIVRIINIGMYVYVRAYWMYAIICRKNTIHNNYIIEEEEELITTTIIIIIIIF